MPSVVNARRARRLVLEHPVVYYADVDPELRGQLRLGRARRGHGAAHRAACERRAEGVALMDSAGRLYRRGASLVDRHGRAGRAAAVRADRRLPAAPRRHDRTAARGHRRRTARRGGPAHRRGPAGPGTGSADLLADDRTAGRSDHWTRHAGRGAGVRGAGARGIRCGGGRAGGRTRTRPPGRCRYPFLTELMAAHRAAQELVERLRRGHGGETGRRPGTC